jgi:predicted GNAT family acetyltransferase
VPAARFAGQGGPLEIVCAEKYTTDFLAQCAFTPGIAAVYEDLLTFGLNKSEIYKVQVPSQLQGKGFAEVLERFTGARRQTKEPIIPIGVCRASSVHLNPTEDEIGVLLSGDEIIVISDHQPKL